MAKKKDNKKASKKAKPVKPAKKEAKARPSKPVKKAKPAPKAKKAAAPAKKHAAKAAKPSAALKKAAPAKPQAKKQQPARPLKPAGKAAPAKAGKPIEAIVKKGGEKKTGKQPSGKKGGEAAGEEEEVKDDYEKPEEEETAIEGPLEDAAMLDLEGASAPEIDEDDDEVPEKRGRGRRKKNEGKSTGGTMEAYIRNRPLQIDINRPLIKKGNAAAPKPFVNTDDKRTRYSDKELAEFKELILEKLKEAQADYDLLKQTLSNEDNHGTDDTSPSFKLLEDGSDVMSKEETAQLASRQEKYIINLKNALVRIENKAYGICRVTGKLIPKERLRSVPHATLGIDAKLSQG
jgi:DnaK suppressor protein